MNDKVRRDPKIACESGTTVSFKVNVRIEYIFVTNNGTLCFRVVSSRIIWSLKILEILFTYIVNKSVSAPDSVIK